MEIPENPLSTPEGIDEAFSNSFTEEDEEIFEEPPAESQEPLPRQVLCSSCNSRRQQLLSFTFLKGKVLISIVCLNCGMLNDFYIKPKGVQNKEKPQEYKSYVG